MYAVFVRISLFPTWRAPRIEDDRLPTQLGALRLASPPNNRS